MYLHIVIGTANRSDDQSSACFAGRLSSAASQFPISCAVNECRPLFTGLLPAAVLFDFNDIYVRPCCRDNGSKIVHTLFTTLLTDPENVKAEQIVNGKYFSRKKGIYFSQNAANYFPWFAAFYFPEFMLLYSNPARICRYGFLPVRQP